MDATWSTYAWEQYKRVQLQHHAFRLYRFITHLLLVALLCPLRPGWRLTIRRGLDGHSLKFGITKPSGRLPYSAKRDRRQFISTWTDRLMRVYQLVEADSHGEVVAARGKDSPRDNGVPSDRIDRIAMSA